MLRTLKKNKSGSSAILLAAICGVLVSCANEEVIEVEKPAIDQTVFDITDRTASAPRMRTKNTVARSAMSRPGVEVYALDGSMQAENVLATGHRSSSKPGVEVFPLGPADNTNAMDLIRTAPEAMPGAPLTPVESASLDGQEKNTGRPGGFVLVKTDGQETTRIDFAFGSADLGMEDVEKIGDISLAYNLNTRPIVHVEGYASPVAATNDPVKRREINLQMSMKRAYEVSRALMLAGIPNDRVRAVGLGEANPEDIKKSADMNTGRVDMTPLDQ